MKEGVYKVDGMTCGGCVRSVTAAIQRVSPDVRVDVDLASGRVDVQGAHDEARVRQAIEEAGFEFKGRFTPA